MALALLVFLLGLSLATPYVPSTLAQLYNPAQLSVTKLDLSQLVTLTMANFIE
jgi:hypothetical protein